MIIIQVTNKVFIVFFLSDKTLIESNTFSISTSFEKIELLWW